MGRRYNKSERQEGRRREEEDLLPLDKEARRNPVISRSLLPTYNNYEGSTAQQAAMDFRRRMDLEEEPEEISS